MQFETPQRYASPPFVLVDRWTVGEKNRTVDVMKKPLLFLKQSTRRTLHWMIPTLAVKRLILASPPKTVSRHESVGRGIIIIIIIILLLLIIIIIILILILIIIIILILIIILIIIIIILIIILILLLLLLIIIIILFLLLLLLLIIIIIIIIIPIIILTLLLLLLIIIIITSIITIIIIIIINLYSKWALCIKDALPLIQLPAIYPEVELRSPWMPGDAK